MVHLYKCVCTESFYVDKIDEVPVQLTATEIGVIRTPSDPTQKAQIDAHSAIPGHLVQYIQEV